MVEKLQMCIEAARLHAGCMSADQGASMEHAKSPPAPWKTLARSSPGKEGLRADGVVGGVSLAKRS